MKSLKVIYIAGHSRSGSTLLARILGTLDGVSSLCEIHPMWEGLVENRPCSCGRAIKECPYWIAVNNEVFSGEWDVRRALMLQNSLDRVRYFPKLYAGIYGKAFKQRLIEYKKILHKLYNAIAEKCGNDIIIDSSKSPTRALLLSEVPGIELHIIHIIRDIRAVVYARQKIKYNPGRESFFPRSKPSRSVLFWAMFNVITELFAKRVSYRRVLYEEFAQQPKKVLQRLVDDIGPVAGKQLPFVDEDSINLDPIHAADGNPQRFSFGLTKICLDDEWVSKLDPKVQYMTLVSIWPLLLRYGFKRNAAQ
jgi:hypothetical protein